MIDKSHTPDGTPIYRTGSGRLKVAFNLLRLRLRIWKSAERYQESIREADKAARLSTSREGVFVRQRPGSAPMRVVAADARRNLYAAKHSPDGRWVSFIAATWSVVEHTSNTNQDSERQSVNR